LPKRCVGTFALNRMPPDYLAVDFPAYNSVDRAKFRLLSPHSGEEDRGQ
jgi:hypothetical protein